MKKLLCIIPTVLLLSACSPSVQDYVDDPQKLAEAIESCMKAEMEGKEIVGDQCKNAAQAQKQVMKNALNGLLN
ncbi:EexN family lipoprotein [Pseudoalteromonas sp. MMG010]|uniref:EexN family lipoprotein n=1 Tax=Pseudoalteromonas sp. MMG010 TaxID=2822685 RepID=UPI001B39FF54|nr:EexN family lipoprotein [Pseudoalteromonas sp. MMG010]MBQ4834541.1 EexN family lipoprotein [Pseudoalteromonas sp. MMG010]